MEASVFINEAIERVEPYLKKAFPESQASDITVQAAMYSLLGGGKRIRPCFMYQTAKMLGQDPDSVSVFACALEMIHTYSLIHDDLPALDNDDLRRGKPTCHKKFGEDIAVLAGDALLNRAFEILMNEALTDNRKLKAACEMARLAGISGMLGGQSIDVSSEGKQIDIDTLYLLQEKKTGALIEAAFITPCILFDADQKVTDLVRSLAGHVGLSFQIRDDILDVISNEEELGKSTGKDLRDKKSTFVTMLGLEGAKEKLDEQIRSSYDILDDLSSGGLSADNIRPIISFIAERNF